MRKSYNTWSDERPDEAGYYWLYGYPYNKNNTDSNGDKISPKLLFIESKPWNETFILTLGGSMLYSSDFGDVKFKKADPPKLPKL
jgi:hypothetical protein